MASRTITLLCPGCGKSAEAKRQPYDPSWATTAKLYCPDCHDGDFDAESYSRAGSMSGQGPTKRTGGPNTSGRT